MDLFQSFLTSPCLSVDQQAIIDYYFNQTTSDLLLASDDGFMIYLHNEEDDIHRPLINGYVVRSALCSYPVVTSTLCKWLSKSIIYLQTIM